MSPYIPRANDKYSLSELPEDIIEALDFWAAATPHEPALKFPRGPPAAEGMETVSFAEWKTARDLMAIWLAIQLDVGAPDRLGGPSCECTVTFLISPSHEAITPWFAMASLGFTVQFISPAHQPLIVAKLIRESKASVVLHHNMDGFWLREIQTMTSGPGVPPEFLELPRVRRLLPLLDLMRGPSDLYPDPIGRVLHTVKPYPFVYLHSFGSTGNPKLYPIDYLDANASAKDAAFWSHQQPVEKRWRCQLQTSASLPFHFSFQNSLWRSLICGTTCVFPVLDCPVSPYRLLKLVPDATDILESLHLSEADIVYASPNGLQAMLEKAASPDAKETWRAAVRNLKEAHTGAAPVSIEKAECFERHGLSVLQVFALTEAGLLFHARKEHTGNTTWLKPLIHQKAYMLFRQTQDPEVYQLWLRSDFPGLRCPSGGLQRYPEDPTIYAWNTNDLFNKLPEMGSHDDLVTFVGREDDWLRCTHGTAVKALELEDFLLEALRDVLGFDQVEALTVIGHGRAALGVVLQGDKPSSGPTVAEVKAFKKVAHFANKKLLQDPAMLDPVYLIRSDATRPIRMTLKGSLMRKENEAIFGPILDQLLEMNGP